jgi:HKD family nuclease
MTRITTKLSEHLPAFLKSADEIWVAVALMNLDGLQFLQKNIRPHCKQNYLVGIDLPTDPEAFKLLNIHQLTSGVNVRIYSEKQNFHPKLYIACKNTIYTAFVGSANCTTGGLVNNIEITTEISDQKVCKQLILWFEEHYNIGTPLTTSFIQKYEKDYKEKLKRKKLNDKTAAEEKAILNQDHEATLQEKSQFIRVLKKYRKLANYNRVVEFRKQRVKELRKDLDYPNYQKLNLDSYFSHRELGTLLSFSLPKIKREIPKLQRLLKYLCDNSIDLAIRYDRVIKGDMKIAGVGKAFVSKVLAAHDPKVYYVKNAKSENALRKYGITFPRGLSEGEKYKITCKYLQQVCFDTDIKDLAVLDHYLFEEGNTVD